jgi:26S proteasome regulatory subunit N8
LQAIVAGKLPMNHEILYNLQEVFNLLPDQDSEDLIKSFATETNDMMLALYLGSMLRSTVALHNLILNKIKNRKMKEEKAKKDSEKKKDAGKKEEEEAEKKGDEKKDT